MGCGRIETRPISSRSPQTCGRCSRTPEQILRRLAAHFRKHCRVSLRSAGTHDRPAVGLFGGPVFSIYKALTAVKYAAEAKKLGIDCVPIFWLATEDHDLEEVNQVHLPGAEGNLEKLTS